MLSAHFLLLILKTISNLNFYDIIKRTYGRFGREMYMKKSWLKTPKLFKSLIIGKLLGDGSVTKQKGRRPRFQFTHVHTDLDWSQYCYEHLSHSIPLNPPAYKKTIDPRLVKGYSLSYYVQSKTSNIICYLRKKWYSDTGKILPFNLINKYFNNQTLAWWYMDDGHLKIRKNTPQKIILSTDSFTTEENEWLINFLYKKYRLSFRLDKQNRIVLYDQFQIIYFLNLVKPYLHESMHRKIIPYKNIKYKLPSRRTTIYLPASIEITSPTRQINTAFYILPYVIDSYQKGSFYKKYHDFLFNRQNVQPKSYQIVINSNNLSNLQLLKNLTGLTFSQLAELCFIYNDH